jgi:chromosome segregation ATPase
MGLRTLARRSLAMFGLASAAAVERLQDRSQLLEGHVSELRRAVDDARAEAERWRDEAQAATRRAEKIEEAHRRLQKSENDAEDWRARDEKHVGQLKQLREQLQARLDRAQHSVALTREHLLGIETKLDIVEAAIGVLDLRTRDTREAVPGDVTTRS